VQGVDHLVQLLKKRDNELLEAREECQDLKKIAAHKEAYYKQQEEDLNKEMADMIDKAEKEKKLMAEEAQESATISVIEAMYELAKEASDAGFSLPSWDLKGWAQMLGKPEVAEQT
jgi:F0F1-type ATP synthase membrane subunit b/b'